MIYIKKHVPARVKELIEGLSTMDECWELLDLEFGKETELVSDQVNALKNFRYSNKHASVPVKFLELHEAWTKVLTNLVIVKQEHALNHSVILDAFLNHLPSDDIVQRYINMSEDPKNKEKTLLEVVREFMAAERVNQRKVHLIKGDKEADKGSTDAKTCSK